jgi:hypothetical protein
MKFHKKRSEGEIIDSIYESAAQKAQNVEEEGPKLGSKMGQRRHAGNQ